MHGPATQDRGRNFTSDGARRPDRAAPPKKQRDIIMPTHDQAARRKPRPAPTTPATSAGTPEPGGLTAAEIRRIVLDILG